MRLGRNNGVWSVPWDTSISRDHALLSWDGTRLLVERIPTATNPIFFRGMVVDRVEVDVGEHFVIGQTDFRLVGDQAQVSLVSPAPVSQQTFTADFLRGAQFSSRATSGPGANAFTGDSGGCDDRSGIEFAADPFGTNRDVTGRGSRHRLLAGTRVGRVAARHLALGLRRAERRRLSAQCGVDSGSVTERSERCALLEPPGRLADAGRRLGLLRPSAGRRKSRSGNLRGGRGR